MKLESDFWHDLAVKFRSLKERDPDGIWRADWHLVVKVGDQSAPIPQYRLVGSGPSEVSIRYQFDALARSGGPKIYPYMDSLMGWFEGIRASPLNTASSERSQEFGEDGTLAADHWRGSIRDTFQASIDLCKYYESLALETERMGETQEEVELNAQQQKAYRILIEANEPEPEAEIELKGSTTGLEASPGQVNGAESATVTTDTDAEADGPKETEYPISTAAAEGEVVVNDERQNGLPTEMSSAPDLKQAARAKIRSAWLDQRLAQHSEWASDGDLAGHGGPTYNTIQRYRSGAQSNQELYVRRKLAKVLKCDIGEVPS